MEFEDSDTIVLNTDLIYMCQVDQFIKTTKRPTCFKNLYWWLECYPNGSGDHNKGHVGVYFCTSLGGFRIERTFTIDNSDIKKIHDSCHEKPMSHGNSQLLSHADIRSGSMIQNGVIVIRCKVKFKAERDNLLRNSTVVPVKEDNYTVELNRKLLETYKPGQKIIKEKRTIDGRTWRIVYYPCGYDKTYEGFVSVYFRISGDPISTQLHCAMSIGGVRIQKHVHRDFAESEKHGFSRSFTHKQCQVADHKNDIIDIVCKVQLIEPIQQAPPDPTPLPNSSQSVKQVQKTCVKDSIELSILGCQLEDNEIGEFDSTPKSFANGSDKHQWRILCFPAGDTLRSKKHVSLIVEASTTETKIVILSGVIQIAGTTFEKKFNMIVEKDSNLAFPKLISHEELRRIGGIIGTNITMTCDASFETQDFL